MMIMFFVRLVLVVSFSLGPVLVPKLVPEGTRESLENINNWHS